MKMWMEDSGVLVYILLPAQTHHIAVGSVCFWTGVEVFLVHCRKAVPRHQHTGFAVAFLKVSTERRHVPVIF
jgi:hypothetical protein